MQTVCAHCYTRLSHRQQRLACILCPRCEQNWMAGKAARPKHQLPEWAGNPALLPEKVLATARA